VGETFAGNKAIPISGKGNIDEKVGEIQIQDKK
jgi:hypothetical protein